MAQHILEVRVRPARVAVLIDRGASEPDLCLAFEFLSRLWGGRFGQVHAVDPQSCDGLTRFRLGQSRSDFVYGIGLDDAHWGSAVTSACQPRGYGALQPEFVRGLKQSHFEDFQRVDSAVLDLFHNQNEGAGQRRFFRLVSPAAGSPLSSYCAAVFGVHPTRLRAELFDQESQFAGTNTAAFVELATEFVRGWQRSWLDATGHKLTARIDGVGWGAFPPTIVLVKDPIADLSLFWNLRAPSDADLPAWVIPVPADGAADPTVLAALKGWLLAFSPYGNRPNYAVVTSESVGEEECRAFAGQLQAALTGSPIDAVDYWRPPNRLPVVTPYEYETAWPVAVVSRRLTFQPPRPKAFEGRGTQRAWFVDLLKDAKTGRAVKELCLPPSPVASELLNGPCPPRVEHNLIPRYGNGVESVNVRCSAGKEVIDFHLPAGGEVLEEMLREHRVEPLRDEKRSGYLPVVRRFGGLARAAAAFTGQSGAVLAACGGGPKTLRDLKGICKLGGGTLSGEPYLERVSGYLSRSSDRIKRVGRRRFARHARDASPQDLKLSSVLEFWADRGVLSRAWKVGPCPHCHRASFVPQLDIRRRVACPACGGRVTLPESVPLGYGLDEAVRLSFAEGIVPVVLAGRVLRWMTSKGFFWLPGVKYECEGKSGDIDLVACCDGHLVLGECKTLGDTPPGSPVWDEVVAQFLTTAGVARRCGASLVVLAARVGEFPEGVRNRIAEGVGTTVPHLLLNKQDLDDGYQLTRSGEEGYPLQLTDLLPTPYPEPPRQSSGQPRTIATGWGVFTS